MGSKGGIPDAWDDDYEAVADAKLGPGVVASTSAAPRISRAERIAQHKAANDQLWRAAENPEPFHFVEARSGGVSIVNTELKHAPKVLSRKPAKPSNLDASMKAMRIEDDDIDSEEEERRDQAALLKQRQIKAAEERAEKQRKYAERREQLFGPSAQTASTRTAATRDSSTARSTARPKGRGDRRSAGTSERGSASATSAEQSPARHSRQLFDPNSADRPGPGYLERRANQDAMATVQKPIRNPRGPDGSGRGGFGFVPRGNKTPV